MTKRKIGYLLLLPSLCLLVACGDVVGGGDDDGDTSTDTDPGDTSGDLGDVGDVPDDTDPGDTPEDPGDVPDDPTTDDAGPGDPPVDTPTDGSLCGNGTVDTGEECDDSSDFCVDCALVAPTGWVECTDSAGNPAFFLIEDWTGAHTATEFRDHCRTTVEGFSPDDFAFYGLATFYDQDLWDCVEPLLDDSMSYYIGLEQDPGASEPDGGWYWNAWDGSGWSHVDPFDLTSSYLGGSFDDGGGSAPISCGRMREGGGAWTFMDYSCDSAQDWDGICMIRF